MQPTLTISRPCLFLTLEQWHDVDFDFAPDQALAVGTKVEYRGHLPGGMVKALWEGKTVVISPGSTHELS